MRYSTNGSVIGAGTIALKELDRRECIPALAEILPTVPDTAAPALANLLADWGGKEYAGVIRQALENVRYGGALSVTNPDLPMILYRLEGGACAEYLADVLRLASPSAQCAFLANRKTEPMLKEPPIVAVIRELRENPPTPDVQKAAAAVPV